MSTFLVIVLVVSILSLSVVGFIAQGTAGAHGPGDDSRTAPPRPRHRR